MRVLVTGATGFVGRTLCSLLRSTGHQVKVATRRRDNGAGEQVVVGSINGATQWDEALEDVDAVIHLAARVHQDDDAGADANLYLETNAHGTRRIA